VGRYGVSSPDKTKELHDLEQVKMKSKQFFAFCVLALTAVQFGACLRRRELAVLLLFTFFHLMNTQFVRIVDVYIFPQPQNGRFSAS